MLDQAFDAAIAPSAGKFAQTLKARAALRGIVVVESRDDRGHAEYIASMGAFTKAFDSLEALATWLDRVEGRGA